jgi:hypothetical protein
MYFRSYTKGYCASECQVCYLLESENLSIVINIGGGIIMFFTNKYNCFMYGKGRGSDCAFSDAVGVKADDR